MKLFPKTNHTFYAPTISRLRRSQGGYHQCFEVYQGVCRGYHQYTGEGSVHWEDIMSALEDIVIWAGISINALGVLSPTYFLQVLNSPESIHDIRLMH